jgi:hypothetical protein
MARIVAPALPSDCHRVAPALPPDGRRFERKTETCPRIAVGLPPHCHRVATGRKPKIEADYLSKG